MITKKKVEKILKRNDFLDEAEFLEKSGTKLFDDQLIECAKNNYNKGRLSALKDEEKILKINFRWLEEIKNRIDYFYLQIDKTLKFPDGQINQLCLMILELYAMEKKRLLKIQKEIKEIENK